MTEEYKKLKILVIGSKEKHPLADASFDWWEYFKIPYLGDFHFVIINLQTLNKDLLGKPETRNLLNKIREQINEIIWANTFIFCITAPKIVHSVGGIDEMDYSNYSWCPIQFNINNDFKGSEFNPEDLKEKVTPHPYLRYVASWNHYFESYEIKWYKLQHRNEARVILEPILRTFSNKRICFAMQIIEYNIVSYAYGRREREELVVSKDIVFYPPVTSVEISRGIDILLEMIRGKKKEVTLPPWTEKILLPREEGLLTSIEENKTIIKQKLDNIEEDKTKLQKLRRLKGLLTEDGEILEEIVEEAFRLLGIRIEKVEGKKEDRIFKLNEDVIPIEIKGRSASIPERDLTQLIGRLGDIPQPKTLKVRGVLIGNHYKDTPLDEKLEGRNRAFEPNVEEKAKTWNISLLSTLELFKAVKKKLEGENIEEKFFNSIFNRVGIIKID